MKRVVIFDTYPSGQREIDILKNAIESFRPSGWDLMIVSHLPISEDVSKSVHFTIYDSNNTFLPPELTPFWWMNHSNFNLKIFNAGHSLPICRNIASSISLARGMGYKQFVFTESDVVMHPDDLNKLMQMMYDMTSQKKSMLFFRPEEYRDCNSYVYETLLFGGNCDYFLKKFTPPVDLTEWLGNRMGYTLELAIYEKFSNDEENFLIINDHSSRIFDKSDVNLLRYGLFNCEVLHNETYADEPVLFINNALIVSECRIIEVYKNNNLHYSSQLCQNGYWFDSFKMDGSELEVKVYNSEKDYLYFTKRFTLSPNNNFKTKGTIKFN